MRLGNAVLCSTLAALLVGQSFAARPFTWNIGRVDPPLVVTRDFLTVPDGMVWVVEQVSGYWIGSVSGQSTIPTLFVTTSGESFSDNPDRSILYLVPSFVAVLGTGSLYADYGRSVSVPFSGQLWATAAGSAAAYPDRIALFGYLTPSIGGDFNGDSIVDAADYTVYRDQPIYWGPADYAQWSAGFGASAASASEATATPEPSAAVLTLLALGALTRPLRRR